MVGTETPAIIQRALRPHQLTATDRVAICFSLELAANYDPQMNANPDASLDQLFAEAYTTLNRLADRKMQNESSDHVLQPTALVHEVYAKLKKSGWTPNNRQHTISLGCSVMRQVLTDYARNPKNAPKLSITELLELPDPRQVEVRVIVPLLEDLEILDPMAAKVIELKYFNDLADDEVANHLNTSVATVQRRHLFAKKWLRARLS